MEDDDWDHLDFERDDHLEEFCRERLNRVSTIGTKMGWIGWSVWHKGIPDRQVPEESVSEESVVEESVPEESVPE